jgi:hypothetical protein
MNLDELRLHVRQPQTIQFLDAWLKWRGSRLLPRRGDVQLRDIVQFIDRAILFEIIGPDEVMVRVAGGSMRELVGVEMTGKNFKSFSSAKDWLTRSYRFMAMATTPCGSCMVLRDLLPSGRTVVYEIVQLPIDPDEAGKPRQLIASNSTLDRYFGDPRPQDGRVVPIPVDYHFIDIGAGAPQRVHPAPA